MDISSKNMQENAAHSEFLPMKPEAVMSQPESLMIQEEPLLISSEPIISQPQYSQPIVTQSEPLINESLPLMAQTQPVMMQSQSEIEPSLPIMSPQQYSQPTESLPFIKESQPLMAQVKPLKMESQPLITQSQQLNMQTEPVLMQPSKSIVIQSQPTVTQPLPFNTVPSVPYRKNEQWDEKPTAVFICRLCKKTFYNANALQNHKNTQHDGEASCSENEYAYAPTFYDDQDWYSTFGRGGFKFVPSQTDTSSDVVSDGLTTRVFSEDITYIIVKIEGDGGDSKTQVPKKVSPVDLRGPFTCTFPTPLGPEMQCRQIFFNCCDYSLHYREEHTKRRKAALRCQVCEKRLDRDFNPTVSLAAQLQASIPTTFSCRMCGQTFLESSQYDEHNRIVHAKMKPHQCPLCTKRFTQQGGLQQHLRMHSGIRPFACTFCPKAFTQKAGLDQHLRTHTKVKPFICVVCGKSFSQSVHLRQHMRTHTNIQPFQCTVCRRRFKQSSHLNFHMRCHVSDGTMPMESYKQVMQQQNHLEFLNLANLQPVQDGETLYYAAEIAPSMSITNPNNFSY